MRGELKHLPVALLAAFVSSCSGGSEGGANGPLTSAPTSPSGGYFAPQSSGGGACGFSDTACGPSGPCCPGASTCAPNAGNVLGCGAGSSYCCLSCPGGNTCGAGCCPSGKGCLAGGDCGGALCCGTVAAADECPLSVALQCPGGTTCLVNRSATSCGGRWACYLPSGGVACPGEFACPDGASFCPSGTTVCEAVGGVCLVGSHGATNWCCKTYAETGESCDSTTCRPGLQCVPQNGCPGSDLNAANVCRGACGASYPVDCGNYCCAASYPVCGGGASCLCYTN
jgi:hypothetical protein